MRTSVEGRGMGRGTRGIQHGHCNEDFDSEALILAKASNIIRHDIFKLKQCFDGQFLPDCQEKSIPSTRTALVNMILAGPNIRDQTVQDKPTARASQTIS